MPDPLPQPDPDALPFNALDRLRQVALGRRLGMDDATVMTMAGLGPDAYEFACGLLIALEVHGLMHVLGPLPDEDDLDA
jgi:hypothetical protein